MKPFISIEDYIASFPGDIQPLLKKMRSTIRRSAPHATEKISYGMPAFVHCGPLVYFGGFKNHIGFFPTPSGIKAFENDLKKYKTSKGAIQFPLDKPLPVSLISKIVKFRKAQNERRAKTKHS